MVVDAGSCCESCVPVVPDDGRLLANREGLTMGFGVVSNAEDFGVIEFIGD